MHEPSLRTSRLAIAGGLAAALVLTGAGFLLGRTTSPSVEPEPVPKPAQVIVPHPPKVEAPRALSRADIIALANSATNALVSGEMLPSEVAAAAGKRFEIALPFGCSGPSPEGSKDPLRWRYDAEKQTLRVYAAPTRWQADDWGLTQGSGEGPGFEGFWLTRPWSSSDRCPQARGQAAAINGQPITLPGQTLALAEILPKNGQRRERPYQTVQRMKADDISAKQSFRLRLIGRIDRLPDGPPVQCIQPSGIEQRPICLIVASFDEIRLENPETNASLATWTMRQTQ